MFSALLEFALVNYASRSDAHIEKMIKQRRQWEIEREREQQQVAIEAATNTVVDSRLDDGSSSYPSVNIIISSKIFIFFYSVMFQSDSKFTIVNLLGR